MKEIRSFLDELVQMGHARWVDPQHIEVIQPHSCGHLRHFVTPKPESLIQKDSEQVTKASSPLRHSSSSSSPAATAQKPVGLTRSGLEQETTTSSPCSHPVVPRRHPVATPKAESPTERVTTTSSPVVTPTQLAQLEIPGLSQTEIVHLGGYEGNPPWIWDGL